MSAGCSHHFHQQASLIQSLGISCPTPYPCQRIHEALRSHISPSMVATETGASRRMALVVDDAPLAPVAQEVPHRSPGEAPLVVLAKSSDGGQILEHRVTGEVVALPLLGPGEQWRLQFNDEGWAAVVPDGNGMAAWVTTLMQMSLWVSAEGRCFVQRRLGDAESEVHTEWLATIMQKHTIAYMSSAGSPDFLAMPRCNILVTEAPHQGARVFVALKDMQSAMNFQTAFCRSHTWVGKNKAKWLDDLAFFGASMSHFRQPVEENVAEEGLRVHEPCVSMLALLIILARCVDLREQADQRQARLAMCGLVARCLEDGDFCVDDESIGMTRSSHGCNVTVDGGHMSWDCVIPALVGFEGQPVDNIIERLWNVRRRFRAVASQFFWHVAMLMDSSIRSTEWATDPLSVLAQAQHGQPRRRADRALRMAVLQLPLTVARNSRRASSVAGALGLDCPASKVWEESAFLRRYLVSCRKHFDRNTSYAIAPDKSGFPPKEFVGCSIIGHESGKIAWAPPQVGCRPHTQQGRGWENCGEVFWGTSQNFCCRGKKGTSLGNTQFLETSQNLSPNFAEVVPRPCPLPPMANPQVVKAFKIRPEPIAENVMAAEVANWRSAVNKFLMDASGEGGDSARREKRWARVATLDLVASIDWMLQCSTGDGLWQFLPGGVELPLAKRQRLTICCDDGPDNICMSSYILNSRLLRATVFFDCSHKLWRCLWGGVQDANLTAAIFVGSVICNLDRGPFHGRG